MPVVVDIELALDKEGYFLGKRTKIIGENGAYTSTAPAMLSVAASRARLPISLPFYLYRGFSGLYK